jgi:hypothetical protein
MRLLGTFLVISSALAAGAAADPIGDRADFGPQVDALSATVQGKGVADRTPPGASLAPGPNATPRTGNPLWAIPLSELSATRDRPLFSDSRRPPVIPVAPPPPKQEAPPPPPPEQPSFTLTGTIVSKEASVASLRGSNNDAISLRLGGENNGWQVRGIGLRSIVLEKGAQSVELNLPKPDGAPPAPPDLPRPDGTPTAAGTAASTRE